MRHLAQADAGRRFEPGVGGQRPFEPGRYFPALVFRLRRVFLVSVRHLPGGRLSIGFDEGRDSFGDRLGCRGERQRAARQVLRVVAECRLGIAEPDVVPAAVLAPLDDAGRPVAVLVVPQVFEIAADAEAAARLAIGNAALAQPSSRD